MGFAVSQYQIHKRALFEFQLMALGLPYTEYEATTMNF